MANHANTPRVTRQPVTPARIERMVRGLRLVDVSDQTGISTCELSQIERGLRAPSSDQQAALARFYDEQRVS